MSEPLTCVPRAAGTMPAPTAQAEPDEVPPAVWASLNGLRVQVNEAILYVEVKH